MGAAYLELKTNDKDYDLFIENACDIQRLTHPNNKLSINRTDGGSVLIKIAGATEETLGMLLNPEKEQESPKPPKEPVYDGSNDSVEVIIPKAIEPFDKVLKNPSLKDIKFSNISFKEKKIAPSNNPKEKIK